MVRGCGDCQALVQAWRSEKEKPLFHFDWFNPPVPDTAPEITVNRFMAKARSSCWTWHWTHSKPYQIKSSFAGKEFWSKQGVRCCIWIAGARITKFSLYKFWLRCIRRFRNFISQRQKNSKECERKYFKIINFRQVINKNVENWQLNFKTSTVNVSIWDFK